MKALGLLFGVSIFLYSPFVLHAEELRSGILSAQAAPIQKCDGLTCGIKMPSMFNLDRKNMHTTIAPDSKLAQSRARANEFPSMIKYVECVAKTLSAAITANNNSPKDKCSDILKGSLLSN